MSGRYHRPDRIFTGKSRKLKELMLKSDNRTCADCGGPDPKWASANIGVFLCLKCSDVHRSLGPDISKVLSITLDEWEDPDIDSMVEVGGNSYANSIYEAFLPQGYKKPRPDASVEERTNFIRSKYELQEFLKPSLRIVSNKMSFRQYDSVNSTKSIGASPSMKKLEEDTREFVGTLNVKVIKGTNLAVRDIRSSDPYVVLNLGHQKVQTTVKQSDLNPVWDEMFKLKVPQHYGPLKLQVYDHDFFSADDIMGEAEVDLQPMVTSALAFGDPSVFGDMQIGKWFKTNDNALIRDSTVNIVDGKIKQEVSLKLQNVESGDLDLELEWVSLEE
ncbi:Calcium-dependent ARF-type GTPase activating protein family [Rhynchospora pubera]|uniref:Calcium-dependent ARF-type GTPase activating protein family n=1 Tax=Rhynchospora pubera TaxID=906938 RepID=A0AAV8HGP5_9POAL|nr:Calcium-dependent ARF-type GTPase activating protein family [Rhynchospora pubera]